MEINLTHAGLIDVIKTNIQATYFAYDLQDSDINVTFEVYKPVDRAEEILTHIKVDLNGKEEKEQVS